MESSHSVSSSVPFGRQIIQNKFLLLTMALAISAAIYFVIGMYLMLRS